MALTRSGPSTARPLPLHAPIDLKRSSDALQYRSGYGIHASSPVAPSLKPPPSKIAKRSEIGTSNGELQEYVILFPGLGAHQTSFKTDYGQKKPIPVILLDHEDSEISNQGSDNHDIVDLAESHYEPPVRQTFSLARKSEVDQKLQLLREELELKESAELFVYPFEGQDCVTMWQNDARRLDDQEFLNDSIIEFYLKWIYHNMPQERKAECYFFNTFFFKKLTEGISASSIGGENKVGFERVQKWTKKVDLFRFKYIFVPINEKLHWFLALIVNPSRLFEPPPPNPPAAPPSLAQPVSRDSTGGMRTRAQTRQSQSDSYGHWPIEIGSEGDDHSGDDRAYSLGGSAVKSRKTGTRIKRSATETVTVADDSDDDRGSSASYQTAQSDVWEHPGNHEKIPTIDPSTFYNKAKRSSTKSAVDAVPQSATFDPDRPYIFLLDSLATNRAKKRPMTILYNYLKNEALDKLERPLQSEPVLYFAKVPQQSNYCDCGVYLLHYVEHFLRNPEGVLPLFTMKDADASNWDQGWLADGRDRILDVMMDTARTYYQQRRANTPISSPP
ncbi:hypothetical protein RI367_005614 [Sorochytrium milnesiophthora]